MCVITDAPDHIHHTIITNGHLDIKRDIKRLRII